MIQRPYLFRVVFVALFFAPFVGIVCKLKSFDPPRLTPPPLPHAITAASIPAELGKLQALQKLRSGFRAEARAARVLVVDKRGELPAPHLVQRSGLANDNPPSQW